MTPCYYREGRTRRDEGGLSERKQRREHIKQATRALPVGSNEPVWKDVASKASVIKYRLI